MKRLLLTTALAMAPAIAGAAPITGIINFDGSDTYNASTVTFVGNPNVSSDTGTLGLLGACNNCVTAQTLTWSPYSGSLANFLSVTNNGITVAIDLGAMNAAPVFNPGVDLDLTFNAVLHETGFTNTAGILDFSTQGPGSPTIVSFSATSVPNAVPEPGSLAVLGIGLLGLGLVAHRRRRA